MYRFIALSLLTGLCFAQAPAADPPPSATDEALRARIRDFYQLHVDGKFRQAEALVAEESKDAYYQAPKTQYLKFEIKNITWSENFTRAKAVVACTGLVVALGFADKPRELPITSTWKLENGNWYWYLDPDTVITTPFGKSRSKPPAPGDVAAVSSTSKISIPTPDQMKFIFTQLKADKEMVTLKAGQSAEVTLTNTAAGPMSIALQGAIVGVDVKLDRLDLKAGEKAVLSMRAKDGAQSGTLSIQVEQTNQIIPIRVNIEE